MDHLESKDIQIQSLEELSTEMGLHISALIMSVLNGLCAHLGIDPDTLATRPPKKLLKGFLGRLAGIGRRLKRFVGRRNQTPDRVFKIKGKPIYQAGKPMTVKDWQKFENQVTEYMQPVLNNVAEEMAVKGVLLAMAHAEAEAQGKGNQFEQKGYEQIEKEWFHGLIPDNLKSAEERFEVNNDIAAAIKLAEVQAADHVQKVDERVRGAIKTQVISAHKENKSAAELASDLYWMKDDRPELSDYTAENLQRDWMRVAKTEMAMINENGRLAAHEAQARKSMKDNSKAVYFVYDGHPGACPDCKERFGTVARMVPKGEVSNLGDEDPDSYFDKDPHAEVAIYQGKNNVGRRKSKGEWLTAIPMHPWCRCKWTRFDPVHQEYDKENLSVKVKEGEPTFLGESFFKERETTEARIREIREKQEADRMEDIHKRDVDYYTRPGEKLIGFDNAGGRIVEIDIGTRYVEVEPSEFNKRLQESREDDSLPIPVNTASKDWQRIFGEFESKQSA